MTRSKAIITGATGGIGAVYADRLADRGHDLILTGRDLSRLSALADRLGRKTQVETLAADLDQADDLSALAARLESDASLTLLVNNAGIASGGRALSADLDEEERLIRLNVIAATRLALAAARNFAAQGRGTIINIASVTALMPERFPPVYPATKAYLLAFGQSLAAELAPAGVRVHNVLPGATRTEIWERAGLSLDAFPPEMVMEVDEMVDAAPAGFDQGELVTIPSLPDAADWQRLETARAALGPNLSRNRAAARFGLPTAA